MAVLGRPATLAIVIPFYKLCFFEQLLDAIENQTNKSFRVYIGDDKSPEDPYPLIESFSDKFDISYHRFTERLGHVSLASHWNRCLKLIGSEPWVWVLPDDDLPSLNCVEELVKALDSGRDQGINIFTLPLRGLDEGGRITEFNSCFQDSPDNLTFYKRQLSGEQVGSTLGDNIFRREALMESGGFVDFPKAWGSDHATVIRAAKGARISCLTNTYFLFRSSGVNISSQNDDGGVKMKARLLFADWLRENASLFPRNPDRDFWKFFYWKSEFYAMNVWSPNIEVIWYLVRLRWFCMRSLNIFSILKLLFMSKKSKVAA